MNTLSVRPADEIIRIIGEKMKKIIFIVLTMTFSIAAVFAATEEVDVYAYLYNNTITNSAQLDILQHMAQAKLTGAGEFSQHINYE
jgi:hypothetical protein